MSLNGRYSSTFLMRYSDVKKGLSEFTNIFLILNSYHLFYSLFLNIHMSIVFPLLILLFSWTCILLDFQQCIRGVLLIIKHGLKTHTWPLSAVRYYIVCIYLFVYLFAFSMTCKAFFKYKMKCEFLKCEGN